MAFFLRTLVKNKYLYQGIQCVFGLGPHMSKLLCVSLGFHQTMKLEDLSSRQLNHINKIVEDLKIPHKSELQLDIDKNLKKMIEIKIYRGNRHKLGLPLRGQRTKTNARTQKKLRRGRSI